MYTCVNILSSEIYICVHMWLPPSPLSGSDKLSHMPSLACSEVCFQVCPLTQRKLPKYLPVARKRPIRERKMLWLLTMEHSWKGSQLFLAPRPAAQSNSQKISGIDGFDLVLYRCPWLGMWVCPFFFVSLSSFFCKYHSPSHSESCGSYIRGIFEMFYPLNANILQKFNSSLRCW